MKMRPPAIGKTYHKVAFIRGQENSGISNVWTDIIHVLDLFFWFQGFDGCFLGDTSQLFILHGQKVELLAHLSNQCRLF